MCHYFCIDKTWTKHNIHNRVYVLVETKVITLFLIAVCFAISKLCGLGGETGGWRHRCGGEGGDLLQ